MDHWLAMDDLSRGLRDETARVTFRDRAAVFIAAQGVLANRRCTELARACIELIIAHDPIIPGNKKLMAVAERSNGIVQMWTRALLMQAGLPPPF
eukprot:4422869-Pyramimonas_sp.AAC.1